LLRHVVLVGFKPETTPDQRAAVHQAIEAMPAGEPEIKALTWGENVGSGPNHFDLAVVMDFADIDAFRRYVGGAVHQSFVNGPAKAAVDRLAVVQHHW
jgi:hypothetical protein